MKKCRLDRTTVYAHEIRFVENVNFLKQQYVFIIIGHIFNMFINLYM